jgi:ATP-dependent protease HslVU (ClpYQ) peptidase subunit
MSTVVGIVENGKVYLGADSLASTEEGDARPMKTKKIFRNGPYLIGFIGSVRGGQILYPEYFTPPKKIMELPDAIIKQSEEKGCLLTGEQSQSLHACNFLIGYKKQLWEILVDFQMTEVAEYTSIGSGSYYAFGSLHTTNQMKDSFTPEMRMELALSAAEEFSTSTRKPFYYEVL